MKFAFVGCHSFILHGDAIRYSEREVRVVARWERLQTSTRMGRVGDVTYFIFFQPSTKPSLVNSPIDGDRSNSAMPRHTTSSSLTLMSPKYFIAPSMPIASGVFLGESVTINRRNVTP